MRRTETRIERDWGLFLRERGASTALRRIRVTPAAEERLECVEKSMLRCGTHSNIGSARSRGWNQTLCSPKWKTQQRRVAHGDRTTYPQRQNESACERDIEGKKRGWKKGGASRGCVCVCVCLCRSRPRSPAFWQLPERSSVHRMWRFRPTCRGIDPRRWV